MKTLWKNHKKVLQKPGAVQKDLRLLELLGMPFEKEKENLK